MTFEICEKCGKRRIVTLISLSEVRRAAMTIDLCRCEEGQKKLSKNVVDILNRIRTKAPSSNG